VGGAVAPFDRLNVNSGRPGRRGRGEFVSGIRQVQVPENRPAGRAGLDRGDDPPGRSTRAREHLGEENLAEQVRPVEQEFDAKKAAILAAL